MAASWTAAADGRKIRGHVMLESVFADVVQQLLHLRNLHHAGAAKRVQRIVGKRAFAHVAAHLAAGVVGREARKLIFSGLIRPTQVP